MGFDVCAVDRKLLRHRASCRDLLKNTMPDAPLRPAMVTVVDGLGRAVFDRNVAPTAAYFQHMENAGKDAPIIYASGARLVLRQMRFNCCPGCVGKLEKIAHCEPPLLKLKKAENQPIKTII
jgi:hypothetical protein